MGSSVIANLGSHELLHTYLLERFGLVGCLSYRDLSVVDKWLKAAKGNVDVVLLVLEDLKIKQSRTLNLHQISKTVLRKIREKESLSPGC